MEKHFESITNSREPVHEDPFSPEQKILNTQIQEIMNRFSVGEKASQDFHRLWGSLAHLKMENEFGPEIFDKAWKEEQVLELLRQAATEYKIGEGQERAGEIYLYCLFSDILSAVRKESLEQTDISDQTAKALIQLFQEGVVIGKEMDEGLNIWFNHCPMIQPDLRIRLTAAMLNNPGQVSHQRSLDLILSQAYYGEEMLREMEGLYQKESASLNLKLKIIDILEAIAKLSEKNYDLAPLTARRMLRNVLKKNDNYFIAQRISKERLATLDEPATGQYYSKKVKMMMAYRDRDLDKMAPKPLEQANFLESYGRTGLFYSSRISPFYGVIYNFEGDVDSFFDASGITPKNLRIEEVLRQSGYVNFDSLSLLEQEALVETYKSLINVNFRNRIEEEFSIKLNQFSIRQQVQFVSYLSTKSIEEMKQIKEFFKRRKSNENYLKSFLSLEIDKQDGNRILQIGELEKSEKVQAKIAEIIDKVEEDLSQLTSQENTDFNCIRLEILKKAHEIILKFSGQEEDVDKLLKDLDDSKIEITLLAALLKTYNTQGEKINYELIKDLKLEIKEPGEDVSQEEKAEMLRLFEKNYREVVFPDNENAAQSAIDEFREDLYSPEGLKNQKVFILRFQGQIIAFCRFKPLDEKDKKFLQLKEVEKNALYAKSLNVHQEVNKLSIGRYFSDIVLPQMRKGNILYAITRTNNPAIPMYEKQEFVIDKNTILRKENVPEVDYFRMRVSQLAS